MNRALTLASFGDGYRALVIGASGALGTAFCQLLKQDPRCADVRALGRRTLPRSTLNDLKRLPAPPPNWQAKRRIN